MDPSTVIVVLSVGSQAGGIVVLCYLMLRWAQFRPIVERDIKPPKPAPLPIMRVVKYTPHPPQPAKKER